MYCRKMNCRLQNSKSKHFFQSLNEVKEITFKPHAVQESSTNKTHRGRCREQDEIINDWRLLEDIIKLDSAPSDSTMVNFPNMLLAAKNILPNSASETPSELYTSATCVEVHQLLIKLLSGFRDTVGTLSANSKAKPINKTAFKNNLAKGRSYGYGLMRMARSRAFQMHMENIELLLSDYTPTDTEA